jgi:5-methyltetrahydrofolate--homocysteine methyltransferase
MRDQAEILLGASSEDADQQALVAAMRGLLRRFEAGEVILPQVLRAAEVVHRTRSAQDEPLQTHGTVVVATLEGDVHDIGKSLLVTILGAVGYEVRDLGSQVPIDDIVTAAAAPDVDALGLSALLVTTSRGMPECVRALDRHGVHVPVLLGGAAINRAFGRRAGLLPDGRVYEPGVFYCKDVFEGVATLDALLDPGRRQALIDSTHAEIEAERDAPPTPPVPRPATGAPRPRTVDAPRPPYWGVRRIKARLEDVWEYLDTNTLFRHHWGGYRARGPEYARLVGEQFEPDLRRLRAEALEQGWLEALIVSGYFACRAEGERLLLFDTEDRHLGWLDFPRQPDGDQRCLADYFRPDGDVVVLQAVSAGARAGEYVRELQRRGEYLRMLQVNGLASSTAEALADYAHLAARRDLGLTDGRGLRFSWGYPACPDLHEQRKVLTWLRADDEIGLRLTRSDNLDPEHSTAAMVVHHPEVAYFAVRSA